MELRVERLEKSYGGKIVLSNLSFTAGTGVTCVLGPSGAGKTTLLRLIMGLEAPDGGTISGGGGLRWGAVFQEDRLLEHMDAAGNLRFALGAEYEERAALALLADLGLGGACTEKKAVRDYSGGMKRRLALARALLAPGEALALDEPFSGLDGGNRRRALEAVRQYGAGKITLLVTHDPADGEALGAAILRLGE